MGDQDNASIIHKKTRVAREDFDARAMSPAKALRLALAKSADKLLGLALTVTTLEQKEVSAKALLASVQPTDLLLLLDGAGGMRGAVMADCQVVSALIEMQISGAVRAREAPVRTYTSTDAAMVAPLINDAMTRFDQQLCDAKAEHVPLNLRFGDKVDDARALSLVLEGGDFELFRLTVEMEEAAKTGVLSVALPRRTDPPKTTGESRRSAPASIVCLEATALNATVALDVIAARVRKPLDEVCALEPGMVLPLPLDTLAQSQLVAPPRHAVAEVRLGQINGMRAIRVVMSDKNGGQAVPEETSQTASPRASDPSPDINLEPVQYSELEMGSEDKLTEAKTADTESLAVPTVPSVAPDF